MNSKKTLIPIVAIGALILSLFAVFTAFGAGTASFIVPGDIDNANNGSLTDSTPDEQEYGRQGGEVGLFLEDDALDVPIRRVLIPGSADTAYDTVDEGDSGEAHVTAHSDVIYTTAELETNDYVVVGDYPVFKVKAAVARTSTPAAANPDANPPVTTLNTSRKATDTGNTENDWYLRIEAPDANGTTGGTVALNATGDIANIVFGGFKASETVTGSVKVTPAGAVATNLEAAFSTLPTAASAADATPDPNSVTLDPGNITSAITPDDVMKDTVYTATITFKGSTANDDTPTAAKTDTLRIHVYYPTKATLDRPFPESTMATTAADTTGTLPVREVTISTADMTTTNWSDTYNQYALAVRLNGATGGNISQIGSNSGIYRFKLDNLVATSNIESTNRIPTTNATDADRSKHRLTGNSAGKVGEDDVMVINASGQEVADQVSYIREDQIQLAGLNTGSYLAAWFKEPNDTGGTVTVRSQSYQTKTTVVMQETGPDTGEFAIKIAAVPYGTSTPDDPDTTDVDESVTRYERPMVNAMKADNPLPKFPVNPRDVITLASSDSTGTLTIETTPPSFTGLSPAHNTAGSESRPTVSGQVTDGDSGLDEKNINILFRVDEGGSFKTETVNPKADADSDPISGGFEVSARLGDNDNDVVPDNDATIYWWIMATDKAGNVGYSDRKPTNDDGTADPCTAEADTAHADLDGKGCQPYVILLDDTSPKLLRAETGRNWNSALQTGDSKDKTEYRVNNADASSVMVVFDEHLDVASVSANDFEVNGSTPVDASPRNVMVRDDVPDRKIADPNDKTKMIDDPATYDGNPAIEGNPQDVGEKRGYVFLRLASDLDADAEPKVELVGDVLDLAGNEQDTGKDNDATDRIAPTLTVTVDEGARSATMDKVNLTITADESVGSPTVEFVQVFSYSDKAKVTSDSDRSTGTVKFVSATEYTAVVSAGNVEDGLYTIHVKATDASGGNIGRSGDMTGAIDVSSDTKAILFEHDENIGKPDIDPDNDGIDNTFTIDDPNTYIRIDFAEEAREYDNMMYDLNDPKTPNDASDDTRGDDLDTHAGVTIVSATLNGDDISGMLQSNDAGNVFLYKASGLEIGDHKLEVVAQDAAGNRHAVAEKATITIEERKPYSLKLNPGWNLVSVPGEPMDSDINVVIPADRTDITSVLAFDPTVPGMWLSATRGADGMFAGTLKNIIATRAYWVQTSSFTALKVDIPKQGVGTPTLPPTIELAKGWNMVPVLDVDGDFKLNEDKKGDYAYLPDGSRAYTFNTITNRWEEKKAVELGKGYWVYVDKATIIVP